VLDAQEGPFYDSEAPQLFADTMKDALRTDVQLLTLPYQVNDPDFAMEIVQSLTKFSESIT
jgi:uncharacterized protein (UPF0261 family)